MKVLLFHPTLLPPKDYGGVERVVLWLAKGLMELGHEVVVGAHPGSRLPQGATLLEIDPSNASAEALLERLPPGLDIVHFMAPPESGVLERLPCPGILTVHGNGKPGEVFPKNTVFLSADHARRHGASRFVYNGIDPAECLFEPEARKREFLFLSKTSWRVKNVAGAVKLCAKAGVRLSIAGGNRPLRVRAEVALRPSMRWVGSVNGPEKAALLANALGLVFPVLWPEPFGLVMVEALMSGAPVIASNRGSVPEIVTPDVGYVFDPHGEDAVQVLREVAHGTRRWDPEACRRRAIDKFHYLRMAEAYEEAYRQLRSGSELHGKNPIAQGWEMA